MFVEKAIIVHGDKYDYSYVDYKNSRTKVKVFCKNHGIFEQRPDTHLSGAICPKCSKEKTSKQRTLDLQEVISKAKQVHGDKYDYFKIKNYTKSREKYTIVCPTHGDFSMRFDKHMSGRGCPKCSMQSSGVNKRLLQDEAILSYKEKHGDRYSYERTVYLGDNNKITITCKEHGDFELIPSNHYKGSGCPKCTKIKSIPELELIDLLNSYEKTISSERKVLEGKELDIFIPSKKTAIEFNGLYWHSDKFIDNNYHIDKTNKCLEKDVRLIHIFEDEWINKRKIVESRIVNIIKKQDNKIHARKTVVKEVDTTEAIKFLEENHIQGKLGAKVKLGLYHNEELVSLMTFGSLRKNLGSKSQEGDWELLRFCNKLNTSVVGGASKLLKYFEETYKPSSLISYADRRWSNGNLYYQIGFNLVGKTSPNYFYTKGRIRESRFNFRKDILVSQGFDKNKTEKDIMKERGYNRIYDCGSLKFKKVYL